MTNNVEAEKIFLDMLATLTIKHGFAIGGCGCCGSPYVYPVDVPGQRGEYVYVDTAEGLKWTVKTDDT